MMKKMVALTLLAVGILTMSAIAYAGSDTTGHCKLCNCPTYKQGLMRQFECVCGHSKGVHASMPK